MAYAIVHEPNRGDDIAEYESALGSVRAEVCFWHLADIATDVEHVRFRGEADIRDPRSIVR